MRRFARLLATGSLLLTACAPRTAVVTTPTMDSPGEYRVVATERAATITMDDLAATAAQADVVVFGEQHDDAATHRVQRALLEALGQRTANIVLSLEMFERDVQPVLDDYLAGRVSEADFLARSRPWPRYATDYRPLVELARARGWPVVAANVPRPMASAIGRRGLAALDTLAPAERAHAAAAISCPNDAYRARFMETMRSHGSGTGTAQPGDTLPTAVAERFYLAQCVKDETMAESVVAALQRAGSGATIFHVTGAFHSDFGQGTVERIRRRVPDARVVVLSAVPVADPAVAMDSVRAGRADYVIFTHRPRSAATGPHAVWREE